LISRRRSTVRYNHKVKQRSEIARRAKEIVKSNTNIVPPEMGNITPSDRQRIVYTVCTNNYDTVSPVLFPEPNLRYILFTDSSTPPDGWEVIPWDGGRRESRKPKLLPHRYLPPHDESLYVDGSIKFLQSPILIFDMLKSGFAACPHPKDRTLLAHSRTMLKADFGDNDLICKQVKRYREHGFVDVAPLTENTVLLRKNIDIVNNVNDKWWDEYCMGSSRDQLSLPFVFYSLSFIPQLLPFDNRKNRYYEGWWRHNWHNVKDSSERIRRYKQPDMFKGDIQ
jgi:hypothetical protein